MVFRKLGLNVFTALRESLPITALRDELLTTLKSNQVVVVRYDMEK